MDEDEAQAAAEVVRSGWLTMGETTKELERRFAQMVGVKHAVAVTNCTAALHLANAALGFGPGDEVICPALSFVAGANSIVYTGAAPVFADLCSLDDLTISPQAIEAKITSRTKGIQVMHYAGHPVRMDEIMALAQAYNLKVIEDCAHAPGAEYDGRALGSIGHVGAFSFFSNKNMTTGEGGLVTTNDDDLAAQIRLMRSHGMTSLSVDRHRGHAFTYDVVSPGFNYRIDEIRSAIGLVQLDRLASFNAERARLVDLYRRRLYGLPGLTLPFLEQRGVSVNHIMPLVLDADLDRQAFMQHLKDRRIQTSIHYPPMHLFEYYRRRFNGNRPVLPLTEAAGQREVTLPLYPDMTEADVDYVVGAVAEFIGRVRS